MKPLTNHFAQTTANIASFASPSGSSSPLSSSRCSSSSPLALPAALRSATPLPFSNGSSHSSLPSTPSLSLLTCTLPSAQRATTKGTRTSSCLLPLLIPAAQATKGRAATSTNDTMLRWPRTVLPLETFRPNQAACVHQSLCTSLI